jgi:pyruvate formate lyase activating enzyme
MQQRGVTGWVFNVMRYSLHDGPGLRTTVFLKGCPLECAWCHNPESQEFGPSLMLNQDRCRRCGDCVPACPEHGIADPAEGLKHTSQCIHCAKCVAACLAGARQMAGRRVTVDELAAEVERDAVLFDESGGGVTLSGGEPLAQPDFAEAFLAECRARGIHTVLDTCGYAPRETFDRVAAQADLVFFDLKVMDSRRHAEYTGRDNGAILGNLRALAATDKPVLVRVPLVPKVNDSEIELEAMADLLQECGLRRLHLLPYHAIGREKYTRLGWPERAIAFQTPDGDDMERAAALLRRRGLEVTRGETA